MNTMSKHVLAFVCVTALVTILVPAAANAKTKDHTCGAAGKTLQSAIDAMEPGDTLLVRGTCSESVTVHAGMRDITIDGGGTATVNGANASGNTLDIRGKGITLLGLRVVGGRIGVRFSGGATGTVDNCNVSGAAAHGVGAFTNSQARVVNSTIEGNGASGVCICEHSSGYIGLRSNTDAQASPNTIRNNESAGITVVDSSYAEIQGNLVTGNGADGIVVGDNSSARIGSQTGVANTLQSGNRIEANGRAGITVARSANARIVGNLIVNNSSPTPPGGTNGSHGISLVRGAQADIADNEISGNTGHGIVVFQNSAANLGSDSGTAPADQPNRTTTPNGRQGVSCSLNSLIDGRLGSMIGIGGTVFVDPTCINSLLP